MKRIILSLLLACLANAPEAHFAFMSGRGQTISETTQDALFERIADARRNPRELTKMFPDNTTYPKAFLYGTTIVTPENVRDVLAHAGEIIKLTVVSKPIEFIEIDRFLGQRRFASTSDGGLVLCADFVGLDGTQSIAETPLTDRSYLVNIYESEDTTGGQIFSLMVTPKYPTMTKEMQDALLHYFHSNSRVIRETFAGLPASERHKAGRLLFAHAVATEDEKKYILARLSDATIRVLTDAGLI